MVGDGDGSMCCGSGSAQSSLLLLLWVLLLWVLIAVGVVVSGVFGAEVWSRLWNIVLWWFAGRKSASLS